MNAKIALLTGVSRSAGLGFAVARQLAEQNFHVVLTAREVGQAESLAAELNRSGLKASAQQLDLADASSILALAARLSETFPHIDVLVNNASPMPDFETRSALEVNPQKLEQIFQVVVFGCWNLTQALLPLLLKAPAARIVNVSSEAAQQIGKRNGGQLFSPAYSLAKHTLHSLTATLAAALAHTPILINSVDPGSVATHPERGVDARDRSPAEAAKGVVWAATLPADGPTGGLFFDGKPMGRNS